MNFCEKYGKTVEEAVSLALADLDVSKDSVTVTVLEEPSKGFLGLGAKLAKVRVQVNKRPMDIAKEFLNELFKKMKLDVNFTAKLEDNIIHINIEGKDSGIIIGKRGHTLDSFQYLTSLVVNKNREEYLRVIINAENYREKREQILENLAKRLADKVQKTGRNVRLEPMNPYERRIIHATLQGYSKIETRSEGEDPYRRIIIEKKR
ncbi:MAG: RNA-binding cell elongation regulator Jag/EloR [Peptostreptococcales bacterium]